MRVFLPANERKDLNIIGFVQYTEKTKVSMLDIYICESSPFCVF